MKNKKVLLRDTLLEYLLMNGMLVIAIIIVSIIWCAIVIFAGIENFNTAIIPYFMIITLFAIIGVFFALVILLQKVLLISDSNFFVKEENNMVLVKYIGKYEFIIRKTLIDIRMYDFEKDVTGNVVPFFDKKRVFLSFNAYKNKKIEVEQKENNILKNKKLLCELSENTLGVRKADDSEVKELSERIKKNRLILLVLVVLPFFMCAPVFPMVAHHDQDGLMVKFFVGMSLFLSFVSFVWWGRFGRLRNDKDVIYLIMECIICNKKDWPKRHGHCYKIRCQDINGIYIDDWFECERKTYYTSKANIVVAKQKNGKVYINSFDKLWSSPSRIVRV